MAHLPNSLDLPDDFVYLCSVTYKWLINLLCKMPGGRLAASLFFSYGRTTLSREVFGINFSSPIGLGARIDHSGEKFDVLCECGFSFAEIGPLNPLTVRTAVRQIFASHPNCVPAVNVGRAPGSTDDKEILSDFDETMSLAYDFADMFILDCKGKEYNKEIIRDIISQAAYIRMTNDCYKPVLLGIGTDLNFDDLDKIIEFAIMNGIDGVVAKNPEYIRHIHDFTKGHFPIVGYNHIDTPEIAATMLQNGATLLAITDEIYANGPGYARQILRYLERSNIK